MPSAQLSVAWSYRGFILGSVRRNFQARYRRSVFGMIWAVLQPLSTIIIYTVIFSQIMRSRLPDVDNNLAYSVYLCSGIVSWSLFAEILSKCQMVFLSNANMMKKLSFPRICLPIIVILDSLIQFGIIFGIFLVYLTITGNLPGTAFFTYFPVMLIQILLAVGLGMVIGVLNVFFRDVGQLFNIILTFWFWFTPIVYPVSILPDAIKQFVQFNPMYHLVETYHGIFVYSKTPDWLSLLPVAILAILLCILGMRLFRKHSGEMVDLL